MAARPTARWQRRKEARPKEILGAALALFTEKGYAATRVDDVAARAGVTKGTVYLYFPNKEELFKAVVRDALFPLIAGVEERVSLAADSTSSSALLRSIVEVLPRLASTPAGAVIKIIISEAGNFPEIARFYAEEVIHRQHQLLTGILERGMARGEFRRCDPAATTMCLIGPVALTLIWEHTFAPYDERRISLDSVSHTLIDLLIGGITRRDGDS
jgi:AcrR family transcriptional regulator